MWILKRITSQGPVKAFTRRKRAKTQGDSQGAHTAQVHSTISVPAQIQLDVAPINEGSQPHSLSIQIETPTTVQSPSIWMWT